MGCPLPPPHVCEREPAAQATSRASNHPAAEWRKWSSRSLAREVVTQQIMWPCAPTTEKRGLGGGGGRPPQIKQDMCQSCVGTEKQKDMHSGRSGGEGGWRPHLPPLRAVHSFHPPHKSKSVRVCVWLLGMLLFSLGHGGWSGH